MPFDLMKKNQDTNQENTNWNQHIGELTEEELAALSSGLSRWHRELTMSILVCKHVEAGLETKLSKV